MQNYNFTCFLYVCEHGLSRQGKNKDWRCLGTGYLEDYLDLRQMKCTLHQTLLGWTIKEVEIDGASSTQVKWEMHTTFWLGSLKVGHFQVA
jgi:hypothetical protein